MAIYEGTRLRPGLFGRGSAPGRRSHVVERVAPVGRASAVATRVPAATRIPGSVRAASVTGASATAALRPAHATLPLNRRPAGDSVPRRRARARLRAGRRSGRLGLLLGGIVVAFMLAFFSLAQTVRVTATDYEVNRLLAVKAQLQAERQELLSDLNRLGREPTVRRQAINFGLFPLAEPDVVRAR